MVDIKLNIPDEFFKEEVRCGFTITRDMKKVWAVELDLLNELLKVCNKYGITIFAGSGTLLGAVRHNGFIPWDDDIDMVMFRSDYEKLCSIAKTEFDYPYFFQTEYTDPGTLRGHAQLRNSETTAILKVEGITSFNQGIFIDIFPLDNVIDNEDLYRKQGKKAWSYKKAALKLSAISTRYRKGDRGGIRGVVKDFFHFSLSALVRFLKLEEKFYQKFELECQKYNNKKTELVSALSLDFKKKWHKCRSDFDTVIDTAFEFISIPICNDYDRVLRMEYGDYMTPIKEISYHQGVVFDTEKPYTKYLKNNK